MKTDNQGNIILTPDEYQELLYKPIEAIRRDYMFQLNNHRHQVVKCPTCDRNNGTYIRKLNIGQVFFLYEMFQQYKATHQIWYRYDDIQGLVESKYNKKCTDYSKMVKLGLITPKNQHSEDGNYSGFFSLTKLGAQFCAGEVKIPEYTVQTSEGKILEVSDKLINIHDFMKKPYNFKYNKLINQDHNDSKI